MTATSDAPLADPVAAGMADEESIATLFRRLSADARDVASSEIALVKARVAERVVAFRLAAVLLVIALLLTLATLSALLVGLILTIAPSLGPGWATLIVIGGSIIVIALLSSVALARIKAAMRAPEARP